ncbi:hypothetical protein ANCDUO_07268 [Ancylostoma duodenale]|uniref:Uncharacterized protein n=1 Tax=Ancylostoma duodenale TaxID=51022 RepID=A0A0C2GTY8_9BILA|nr:hypothetical protein ANCDUO_07268 [Ancylostoma duodenale]
MEVQVDFNIRQSWFLESGDYFAGETMGGITPVTGVQIPDGYTSRANYDLAAIEELPTRLCSLWGERIRARSPSEAKLKAMHDLDMWCKEAHPMGLPLRTTSAGYLEKIQNRNEALAQKRNTVLIIINNFPWKNNSMGLLERIYGNYFGLTIFCGKFMKNFKSDEGFPPITSSFSFVEVHEEELLEGYFLYCCLAKVAEMRLRNVKGKHTGTSGLDRVLELVATVYKDYPRVQAIWQMYKHGIRENYRNNNTMGYMASANGYAASDL